MNKLKLKNKVKLRREALKAILRDIYMFTHKHQLDLNHAEELMVHLGCYLKRYPSVGIVSSFGAREGDGTLSVGVGFKSAIGSTGVFYFNEKDLERVYNKRKR